MVFDILPLTAEPKLVKAVVRFIGAIPMGD